MSATSARHIKVLFACNTRQEWHCRVATANAAAIAAARPMKVSVPNEGAGGVLARRLIPVVVLFPPLLGGLLAAGESAGVFSADTAIAILVVSVVIVFSAIIWRSAAFLTHLDAARSASERAARENAALLQAIANNSSAVISAKNLEGRYLLVNRRYHELMNTTDAEVIGRTDFDIFPEEDAIRFRAVDNRAHEAKQAIVEEERLPKQGGDLYFLSTKSLLQDADGAVLGIVGIATEITDRKRAESERDALLLREQKSREETEALYTVARSLATQRDLEKVVQEVTDAATRLTGAQFGAFFRNTVDAHGQGLILYTLSGAPREAFEKFGIPRTTALFEPIFAGSGSIRIADVTKDPRYGRNPPHRGMPEGHLPVKSYLAVPVVSRAGVPLGGLFFGHAATGVFDERSERIAEGIATQAAVAVDNASLYLSLAQSTRRLEAQLGQLRLLAQITRAIDQRKDLSAIFQGVVDTLEAELPVDFSCSCMREGEADDLVVKELGPRAVELMSLTNVNSSTRIPWSLNGLQGALSGDIVQMDGLGDSPAPFFRSLAMAGLQSAVVAPLVYERKVLGALVVARKEAHAFSPMECEFLVQLSEHVALAVQHSALFRSLQQAFEDLRESQQSILQQERLRSLGQLASGIAHDINNGLSPAAVYVDSLLAHETDLPRRARDYLRIVQRAITDVSQTVGRIRHFYRPREEHQLLAVDLAPLISQVIELTEPRWRDIPQERGVNVAVVAEIQDGLAPVMGSEHEIRDSLTNLVFNAVDAMPSGGSITLRAYALARDAGFAGVALEVEDTGIGMDAGTLDRCLEPFFTTKGERGSGLGLAMVYGMTRRHEAKLAIDSVVGRGTRITIQFPDSAHMRTEAGTDSIEGSHPGEPLRVLLVDDDPNVLDSLADSLSGEGHEVTPALGGAAGLAAFSAQSGTTPFDVIITDLGMPHVDGRQVASSIHAISPGTPIILLTGWGQQLQDNDELPQGVLTILTKPARLRDIRVALAGLGRSMP